MKQNHNLKSSLFAAALALGFAASASAQSTNVAVPTPAPADSAYSLLGSRYTNVTGTYYDLRGGSPGVARSLGFTYNAPVAANFDVSASYEYARASLFNQDVDQQELNVGTTAYVALEWGKPFVFGNVGWTWADGLGVKDDSFTYEVGTGVEFSVARDFVVSPFVSFSRATGWNSNEFDYGVKAAYRLTKEWGLTAKVSYDTIRDSDDTIEYAVGVNYSF